jgi:hypothetical protein
MAQSTQVRTATIASGASTSSAIEIDQKFKDFEMGSIVFTEAMTNTSFDVQIDVDGTFYDIYDTFGNKYSITVSTGKHSLPADVFKDVLKIRLSGSQNEASVRSFKVILIDMIQ